MLSKKNLRKHLGFSYVLDVRRERKNGMNNKLRVINQTNLRSLIELNQKLNRELIYKGLCGDFFEELNKLRAKVAKEFLPLVQSLAASGVLSVFIPSDDEDAEPLEIVSAFECESGGLHLVAEDLTQDEETEPEAVNLVN